MKHTIAALLMSTALVAPAAAQQFPLTMPANTVYGRLGGVTGPGSAIPFSVLASQLTAIANPASIIPNARGGLGGANVINNVQDRQFVGGAACNGLTTDTVPIQAAIDAAVINRGPVLIPGGVVCTSGPLIMKSGLKLMGEGPTSTLRAHPSLIGATGTYLLVNQNTGSFVDNAITIENLTIDGNNIGAGATQTVTHGLIGFGHVTNLVLQNIKVYNFSYNCVDLVGVRRARIVNSEFTACGYMDHGVPNNGASLFIANNGADQSTDVLVEGNYFHDAFGMTFAASNSVMNGNVFRDMKEIAINYPGGGALVTQNNVISNNTFDGTVRVMVSGACIEADGVRLTQFIGNTFRNCYQDGILLTNVQDSLVQGNVFSNMGLQPGYEQYSAAVKFHNSAASPNQPQNITIQGNRVYDDQTVPTTGTAVALRYTFGGSTPAINIAITDNDFSKTAFVTAPIVEITAGIIGAGSIIRNNLPTTVNQVLPVLEGGTNCFLASGTCLDNITGFSGVGVLSRGGPATYRANTLTGTANEITVTNGTAASADPVFSLPAALTFTGKTVTGGTFASPTFSGTIAGFPATTCTNQFLTAISAAAVATCTTDTLASAQHANQGTTTTVLHGNAAGNPSWAAVALADIVQSAANTMLGNWTGSTANVSANAMPSCADTTGNHLNYVNGTGITCGTSGLRSKLITSTRDLTAASGSVAYTGVGFVPTSCHANGSTENDNSYASINGFADSSLAGRTLFAASGNFSTSANFMAFVDVTGTKSQTATVTSYDSDGFTLAWTKTSTPTGTATLQFLCYK